jgi:hypothetical protein
VKGNGELMYKVIYHQSMALQMGTTRIKAYEGLTDLARLSYDAQCYPKWETICIITNSGP